MNFPAQPGEVARGTAGAACAASAEPLTVGSVQFRNTQLPAELADEVMEQMADSIVQLTHQLEEANARIALLEEEQRILAKGFPSPAKAAVIEGAERPCNDSAYALRERPEPSPHFNAAMWKKAAVWHRAERLLLEAENRILQGIERRIREERDEARAQYQTTHLLAEALAKTQVELKAERDGYASHLKQVCHELGLDNYLAVEAAIMASAEIKRLKATIESLRDRLCADKCRDKAAADGGWASI
jgi:hypothetical protein